MQSKSVSACVCVWLFGKRVKYADQSVLHWSLDINMNSARHTYPYPLSQQTFNQISSANCIMRQVHLIHDRIENRFHYKYNNNILSL